MDTEVTPVSRLPSITPQWPCGRVSPLPSLCRPALQVGLLWLREGVGRITSWVCHYVASPRQKGSSARVKVSQFQQHCLWSFCVYFPHPPGRTLVRRSQPHLHTCAPNARIPPACPLLLQASGFSRRAQVGSGRPQAGEKFCLAGKADDGWNFTLALSRQNQSVLVATDQYQNAALGARMYLLRERALRRGPERTDVSGGDRRLRKLPQVVLGPRGRGLGSSQDLPSKPWPPLPTVFRTSTAKQCLKS